MRSGKVKIELDRTPRSRPMARTSTERPLYVKLELRAITVRPAIFDKSVMMSSLMPSEKYSCSGSPDMLVNGKTAIDGVSTLGVELAGLDRLVAKSVLPECDSQPRSGASIFFTVMSPPSEKRTSILLPTLSLTIEETQIPPGSASG